MKPGVLIGWFQAAKLARLEAMKLPDAVLNDIPDSPASDEAEEELLPPADASASLPMPTASHRRLDSDSEEEEIQEDEDDRWLNLEQS